MKIQVEAGGIDLLLGGSTKVKGSPIPIWFFGGRSFEIYVSLRRVSWQLMAGTVMTLRMVAGQIVSSLNGQWNTRHAEETSSSLLEPDATYIY